MSGMRRLYADRIRLLVVKVAVAACAVLLAVFVTDGVLRSIRDERLGDAADLISRFDRELIRCGECTEKEIVGLSHALDNAIEIARKRVEYSGVEFLDGVSLLVSTRDSNDKAVAQMAEKEYADSMREVQRLKSELTDQQAVAKQLIDSLRGDNVRAAINESMENRESLVRYRSAFLDVAGDRFASRSNYEKAKAFAMHNLSGIANVTSMPVRATHELIGKCVSATNAMEQLVRLINSTEKGAVVAVEKIKKLRRASAKDTVAAYSKAVHDSVRACIQATNEAVVACARYRECADNLSHDAKEFMGNASRQLESLIEEHGTYVNDTAVNEAKAKCGDIADFVKSMSAEHDLYEKDVSAEFIRLNSAIEHANETIKNLEAVKTEDGNQGELLELCAFVNDSIKGMDVKRIGAVPSEIDATMGSLEEKYGVITNSAKKCIARVRELLPDFKDIGMTLDERRVALVRRSEEQSNSLSRVAADLSGWRDGSGRAVLEQLLAGVAKIAAENGKVWAAVSEKKVTCANGTEAGKLKNWLDDAENKLASIKQRSEASRAKLEECRRTGDLYKVELFECASTYWVDELKRGNNRFEFAIDTPAGCKNVEVEVVVKKNERNAKPPVGLCYKPGGATIKQVLIKGKLSAASDLVREGSRNVNNNFMKDQVYNLVSLSADFPAQRNYFVLELDFEAEKGKSFRDSIGLDWNWDKLSFKVKVDGKETSVFCVRKSGIG